MFLRIWRPYFYRELRQKGGVVDRVLFAMMGYTKETQVKLQKFSTAANSLLNDEFFQFFYIKHYYGFAPMKHVDQTCKLASKKRTGHASIIQVPSVYQCHNHCFCSQRSNQWPIHRGTMPVIRNFQSHRGLRANVTNGQTFAGNRSKINSAHVLMLGRP